MREPNYYIHGLVNSKNKTNHCYERVLVVCLLIIFLSLISKDAVSQPFMKKESKDSVEIYYKWKKQKLLKHKDHTVFVLKIKNNNSHDVQCHLSFALYWKDQLHENVEIAPLCIEAYESVKRREGGQFLNSVVFSKKQFVDPMFLLHIHSIDIVKIESCDSL